MVALKCVLIKSHFKTPLIPLLIPFILEDHSMVSQSNPAQLNTFPTGKLLAWALCFVDLVHFSDQFQQIKHSRFSNIYPRDILYISRQHSKF